MRENSLAVLKSTELQINFLWGGEGGINVTFRNSEYEETFICHIVLGPFWQFGGKKSGAGAGAAWKKKSGAGAGAAKKLPGSPALGKTNVRQSLQELLTQFSRQKKVSPLTELQKLSEYVFRDHHTNIYNQYYYVLKSNWSL